jgi:hypothetical protein
MDLVRIIEVNGNSCHLFAKNVAPQYQVTTDFVLGARLTTASRMSVPLKLR